MTRDEILAALPKLSTAEQKSIMAALVALGVKGGGQQAPTLSAQQRAVFDAIGHALNTKLAPGLLVRGVIAKHFDRCSTQMLNFVNHNFGFAMKGKVAMLALIRFMVVLVVDDLRKKRIRLTPGVVVLNLTRINEIFEDAYPGYLQGGLSKFLVNRILGK